MSAFLPNDPHLKEFATELQWKRLLAYWKHGSDRKAASALGVNKSVVRNARLGVLNRAAKSGYSPEHDMTHPVPDGYKIRGVSTMYDRQGEVCAQWVKSAEDRERQLELLREAIAGLSDEIPRAKPIKLNISNRDDLCAVYPIGDHHLGMYAWDEEAGGNYDLEIAERLFNNAILTLSSSFPAAGEGLLAFLGDFLHYDNLEPVTPRNRNLLDSDTRFGQVVRVAVRCCRFAITAALQRHNSVRVIVQPGNHDPSSSLILAECLSAMYEEEPRVTIDRSPSQFHYFRFGQTLIGVCHGHEVKRLEDLGIIMATDQPEEWGRTRYHRWLTGHIHKDKSLDDHAVKIESFRVLPPTDAWAQSGGYRSGQEMKAFLLEREFGEVQRLTVNPHMFERTK